MELIPLDLFRGVQKLNFQEHVLNSWSLSAQKCMIALTEKSKKCLGNKGEYAPSPINMSKVFECLYHDSTI